MGSVSSLSWRHSVAQRRATTDQASRGTVQVGLLEKGCVWAQPPSPGPLMWVRGSLMLPLIRNESVCFQLNISPTTDKMGLHIPDSWKLGKLYCGSCLVTSPPPGGLMPTPRALGFGCQLGWGLATWGKRCWQFPTASPFPVLPDATIPSPQISSP